MCHPHSGNYRGGEWHTYSLSYTSHGGKPKIGRKQQLSSFLYILSITVLLLFHYFRPEHQQPFSDVVPYFFINNGFNVNQANAGKNSIGTVKPGNNSGCS
jgi:hypothetical protein